jgi:hypothetical protein
MYTLTFTPLAVWQVRQLRARYAPQCRSVLLDWAGNVIMYVQWLLSWWMRDHALGFVPPDNFLRSQAIKVHASPWFANTVLVLIITNCVALALDDPLCDEQCKESSRLAAVLEAAEYMFVAAFSLEIMICVLARGFLLNSQGVIPRFSLLRKGTVCNQVFNKVAVLYA